MDAKASERHERLAATETAALDGAFVQLLAFAASKFRFDPRGARVEIVQIAFGEFRVAQPSVDLINGGGGIY